MFLTSPPPHPTPEYKGPISKIENILEAEPDSQVFMFSVFIVLEGFLLPFHHREDPIIERL